MPEISLSGIDGRTVVVTGGGGAIGEALAVAFSSAGAHVVVADRDRDSAERVAAKVGGTAWHVDLADTGQLTSLALECDVLVNNAGFQQVAPVEDFDPQTFSLMLRVMLEAPFLLIRAALPHMYERKFGRIINISSVHGLRASPFKAAYVAAKHGLEGLSKVVALEGGAHGVTSNCIEPAFVRSPLIDSQIQELAELRGISADQVVPQVMLANSAIKRLIEPEEVASLALWLAGENAGMVTGASYTMDGGWSAR